ncbi:hypothetical protein V5799_033604 [Amblyomma americanum]|uniref:Uncharacterized protein n=1 Tax=Amblyomma americanum TaxID=6943 RepID=A0AAQ4DMV2_AMBAM
MVLTTVVLHNYLRRRRGTRQLYTPPESLDVEDILTGDIRRGTWRHSDCQAGAVQPLKKRGSNCSQEARRIREDFKDYFYKEGQLSWQWRLVSYPGS